MARTGTITIKIANAEGVMALRQAIELATGIVENQPWNDDAKEIIENLKLVAESLGA